MCKKKIILYGAGKRGRKAERLLNDSGIAVDGFCESQPLENKMICNGKTIAVYSFDEVVRNKDKMDVVITVADSETSIKLKEKCYKAGVTVRYLDELLPENKDEVAKQRQIIADYHMELMDDYFEDAEKGLDIWWNKDSIFYKMFGELDLKRVVELACGRGRHVNKYMECAEEIILVDILEKNILYCKERFAGNSKVKYYANNGHDLCEIEDESCSAVFSYDSMVHFELMDIFEYLREIQRILCVGGHALLHHSNNHSNYAITFLSGTHGRNYMSMELFAYLAHRAGLEIMEQRVLDWGGVQKLDGITLLKKAVRHGENGNKE